MDKHKSNQQVRMEHAFQHNIYVKKMTFDQSGIVYCGHHHEYDHVTLVASGRARVKFSAVPEAGLYEEVIEYPGVSMFVTRSFRTHEITALEDNTVVCCIHAIRLKDGEVIDPPSELSSQCMTSFSELSRALNKPLAPLAFDATSEHLQRMLERAKEEDTLVRDSGNKLL